MASETIMRLANFMGEQEEREAVVDWLRSVGDRKPHGTDWRTYYEIADAIELGQHRDRDTHRMAETGTGSVRSMGSPGRETASPVSSSIRSAMEGE